MRRFVMPVLLLTLILAAALGATAQAALLLDVPDYVEPVDCYGCHAPGGAASYKPVDFSVGAVSREACRSCHAAIPLPYGATSDHYHVNMTGCTGCHDLETDEPYFSVPAGEVIETPLVNTSYGLFQTSASPFLDAAAIHAAHTGTSWMATEVAPLAPSCQPCHRQASCSACHTGTIAHDNHGSSSCLSAGCHTYAASGVSVPTCSSCHPSAPSVTHEVSHTAIDGTTDNVACSSCHSLALVAEHGKSTASTSGSSCAACHPDAAATTVPAWDGGCATAGCHTQGSSDPMHGGMTSAHVVSESNALCLDCHAGNELASVHEGAISDGGASSCLVCHTGIGGEPASADCTVCHFTFENHYDDTAHTSSWSLIGCSGSGCHTTRDLMGAHQEHDASFTCDGCHKDFSVALQIEQGLTGCGDCHDNVYETSGHRAIHWASPLLKDDSGPRYSYYTGSLGTQPTSDCAGCHTSNLVDEHMGLVDASTGYPISMPRYDSTGVALSCATCHSSSDEAVAGAIMANATACESCHAVHGPMQQVHVSSFVDNPAVPCADCHSADLVAEHNGGYTSSAGLTGCDVCHALYGGELGVAVQTAIGTTNDTRCSACHPNFHDGLAAHEASGAESLACAECHGSVVDAALDLMSVHPTCNTCHGAAAGRIDWATATMECSSCHIVAGSDYHQGMTAHVSPSTGCTVSGCHHSSPDVSLTHTGGCSTCHNKTTDLGVTSACVNCHATEGVDFHLTTDVRHTPTDSGSTACARCHETTDVRALHVTNSCESCHFKQGCADCHDTNGLLKTTSCGSCHTVEGTDYHANLPAAHTYAELSSSCLGARCHVANTLPEEHERYLGRYPAYVDTCGLCHENSDPNRIPAGATADCSSCHEIHGDIGTIHTASQSQSCVDCHETGDVRLLHGVSADASCDVCHAAADGRIDWNTATAECGSCHGGLSPVDANHYPAAAHDASAEAACGQCHYKDMKAEHFLGTVSPAVTCVSCHELKVDAFTSAWDKTCAACHATKHGEQKTKHASSTTSCGGSECHDITDVAKIHQALQGGGCGTCHTSPSARATITDCTASGCHANVGTDHKAAHDSTSVNTGGCNGCHALNLVDEHSLLGFTCATCHSSAVTSVQSAISSGDLRCASCHPDMHAAQAYEFNPKMAGGHRVSADLPGMQSSFLVNGTTYTMGIPSASSFLKAGWTTNSIVPCDSCHSYSGATGPHGATMTVNIDPNYPTNWKTAYLNDNTSTGMSSSTIICAKCHDLNGTGSSFSNNVHGEGDHHDTSDGQCYKCHIQVPHGWGRPRLLGYTTDGAPYATATGGITKLTLKSYTPTSWSDSNCYAACAGDHSTNVSNPWPNSYTAPTATAGNVTGTVTNSSGSAISGASVSIAGKTVSTSSTGSYTVSDIAGGSYTMTVSASGYNTWSGSVTITNGATTTQNVTLSSSTSTVSNLALAGAASASSTDGSDYPSRAIDGNTSSYWRSGSGGTQWLQVDLKATKTFDKVVVRWYESRYAKSYKIETSSDGTSWTSRYSTTSGSSGSQTITFSPVSARYVRIYCTSANDSHYRITEFEVWGGDGGSTVTTGNVSGTVQNASGATISGASVSIAGKTATTSSTGTYGITGIEAGTYTMTVSASGYNTWSGSVTISSDTTVTQNVTLTASVSNLALAGAASASSTDGSNYPSRAIDGNTSSYWRSGSGGTQWLQVDLKATKTFDKVVVRWYESRYAKSYKIETSPDGKSWTSRYSTTSGSSGSQTITFSPVSARYVRIYCTSANDSHYRITEFEVWGY